MGVLEDKLKLLPSNPGVYVMLDKDGVVIYVGKAKNLKNRVRQYFFNSVKTKKVMAMVSNVADFYYVIAPSEIDALSLENNLIKKHKPRYNILLKDDKTYPNLRIDLKETFPVFKVVRRIKKDGAKYFGPYMGGVNVNSVLETLNLLYGIRPCVKTLNPNKTIKPCLNYHIAKCSAPCAGLISKEEYLDRVKSAISFLSGDVEDAEQILTDKMVGFASNEQCEIALKYTNAIQGLEKLKLKRLTSLNKFLTADIIAYASNGIYSTVNMLFVRQGRMLGSKNFSFESGALSDEQAISEFITRYYNSGMEIPDEIVVKVELPDEKTITEYIKTVTGKNVDVICAKMGTRKQLVDMAEVNATEHLETAVDKIRHKDDITFSACKKLKEVLGLKNFPHRMECYDISNISGVDKVGSMVVFT
ncbi:MAG: excinuclease ABC subunit C, partial [Clostridia bacterium]|nr:excinuclease ABC subunit C [Clostridia bacterium]